MGKPKGQTLDELRQVLDHAASFVPPDARINVNVTAFPPFEGKYGLCGVRIYGDLVELVVAPVQD